LSGDSGARGDTASILERGYARCAPELGINLEEVRRRFMSKTQVKRGSRHRGCACRPFVGDHRRKKVAKKRGTANRKKRYPNFHLPRVGNRSAHRAAYALFVGPIPKKAEIDHSCVDDSCVEPRHLDAIPPEEHEERKGRRRGVKRLRRGTPEPIEVPPRIAARIDHWAKEARVEPAFIRFAPDAYVGRDELQWGQDVVNSTSLLESDRKQIHHLYRGILYLGRWQGLADRMSALVGSLVRCEVDAKLRPLREVVQRGVRADRPPVLGIPDQPAGKLSGRARETLPKLLIARFDKKLFTIFFAPNMRWIEQQLGDEVLGVVQRSYLVLEGAATLDERDSIVERATAKCFRLGFDDAAVHSLVDVARCLAWGEVREDWRDLDAKTLTNVLDAAIKRAVLVRDAEACGHGRAAAEELVKEARRRAQASDDRLLRFLSVAKALSAELGDPVPGSLPGVVRLVRDELRGLLVHGDQPLSLVEEYCSLIGFTLTEEEQEDLAVKALLDRSQTLEQGGAAEFRAAVRDAVLNEIIVRAAVAQGLDRREAEALASESVRRLGEDGVQALPEIAEEVLSGAKQLLTQRLTDGPLVELAESWLAAEPEDLEKLDFP